MKKEINWKAIKPGRWFKAKIKGVPVVGRIQKANNQIYLCQNIQDGKYCPNKFDFKYSWTIVKGTLEQIKEERVENLRFLPRKPKGHLKIEKPIEINGYDVIFSRGKITVGCTDIPNSIVRQVYKRLKK